MTLPSKRLLIVEDVYSIALYLQMKLQKHDMHIDIAESATAAIQMMHQAESKKTPYHIALLDYYLPDCKSLSLVETCLSMSPHLKIIVTSGEALACTDMENLNSLSIPFILKSRNVGPLLKLINTTPSQSHTGMRKPECYKEKQMRNSYRKYLRNTIQLLDTPQNIAELKALIHQLIGSSTIFGMNKLSLTLLKLSKSLKEQPQNTASVQDTVSNSIKQAILI